MNAPQMRDLAFPFIFIAVFAIACNAPRPHEAINQGLIPADSGLDRDIDIDGKGTPVYGVSILNDIEVDTIFYQEHIGLDGQIDFELISRRNGPLGMLSEMHAKSPCPWTDSIGFHEILNMNSLRVSCERFFNAKEKVKEVREANKVKLYFKHFAIGDALPDHLDTYEPEEVNVLQMDYTLSENGDIVGIDYFLSNGYHERIDFTYGGQLRKTVPRRVKSSLDIVISLEFDSVTYVGKAYKAVLRRYEPSGKQDWQQERILLLMADHNK